jgi:hypothetical protein
VAAKFPRLSLLCLSPSKSDKNPHYYTLTQLFITDINLLHCHHTSLPASPSLTAITYKFDGKPIGCYSGTQLCLKLSNIAKRQWITFLHWKLACLNTKSGSRASSVCIVTGQRAGQSGFIACQGPRFFSSPQGPDQPWVPPQPPKWRLGGPHSQSRHSGEKRKSGKRVWRQKMRSSLKEFGRSTTNETARSNARTVLSLWFEARPKHFCIMLYSPVYVPTLQRSNTPPPQRGPTKDLGSISTLILNSIAQRPHPRKEMKNDYERRWKLTTKGDEDLLRKEMKTYYERRWRLTTKGDGRLTTKGDEDLLRKEMNYYERRWRNTTEGDEDLLRKKMKTCYERRWRLTTKGDEDLLRKEMNYYERKWITTKGDEEILWKEMKTYYERRWRLTTKGDEDYERRWITTKGDELLRKEMKNYYKRRWRITTKGDEEFLRKEMKN